MINTDIIIVGPLDGSITGQQYITNYTATLASKNITKISTGGINISYLKFIVLWFTGFIKLTQICINSKSKFIVYLSISRSWAGVLKESYISFLQCIFKFPIVIHWHGAEPMFWARNKNFILSRVFLILWRRVEIHIALTSNMREDLRRLGFCNVFFIRNFPNLNERNFNEVALESNMETVRFLFLSNLMPGKGLEDTIFSLKTMPAKNFTLHIAGSNVSSLSATYKALIDSCEFATYHGSIENAEKENLLKNCDVLIFPSTYITEALPLVVIEAIFAGLAVVAYDHNYMSEFADLPGVIITESRPDKLREVLSTLCINSALLQELRRSNLRNRQIFSRKNYDFDISKILNSLY